MIDFVTTDSLFDKNDLNEVIDEFLLDSYFSSSLTLKEKYKKLLSNSNRGSVHNFIYCFPYLKEYFNKFGYSLFNDDKYNIILIIKNNFGVILNLKFLYNGNIDFTVLDSDEIPEDDNKTFLIKGSFIFLKTHNKKNNDQQLQSKFKKIIKILRILDTY